MAVLHTVFCHWAGIVDTISQVYLLVVAPFKMAAIGMKNKKRRHISKYHMWAYRLSYAYLPIIFFLLMVLLFTGYIDVQNNS